MMSSLRRALGVTAVVLGVLGGPTWADELPDVKSKSAIALDAETGAEIFAKSADEIRPIASTTKIFVAMVVRRRGIDLDGWTKITRTDVRAAHGGARTRLDINESFKNRDLLHAMLMSSDNRAPTALGRAVGLEPKVNSQSVDASFLHCRRRFAQVRSAKVAQQKIIQVHARLLDEELGRAKLE